MMELLFAAFTDKETKEKIFDEILLPELSAAYRTAWTSDDKVYMYGMEKGMYCLQIDKPAGMIYRRYFKTNVLDWLL